MVPSAFIPLGQIPLTPSGKVDRKTLRQIGSQVKMDGIQNRGPSNEPVTECEMVLRQMWSDVLGIATDMIGRDDNFFDIGGDSLASIRLVGVARQRHLPLSVTTIFQHPQLDNMAHQLTATRQSSNGAAITMVVHSVVDSARLPTGPEVSKMLSVAEETITDILPVTDFQHYAIKCAFTKPRTEWNYFSMKFERTMDIPKLQRVCWQLVHSVEILRCIFLPYGDKYIQVFLKGLQPQVKIAKVSQPLGPACKAICQQDLEEDFSPGMSFTSFFIVQNELAQESRLIMRMSHAQYDGVSFPRMAECIGALCDQRPLPVLAEFSTFLKESSRRTAENYTYWSSLLKDSPEPALSFPGRTCEGLIPAKRLRLCKEITLYRSPKAITMATLFSAAWGVALSCVTGSSDIVFGRAVSGRNLTSLTEHHENVVGPCLNLVPVRMKLSSPDTIHDVLKSLQRQYINSIPHEAMGLMEIVEKCTDWPRNTSFGSVFYYQNVEQQPLIRVGSEDVHFTAMILDRADPPEPPRLNVKPNGDGKYILELSIPEDSCSLKASQELLDRMDKLLEPFSAER